MNIVETLRQEHRKLKEAAVAFSSALPSLSPAEAARRLGEIKAAVLAHVGREEGELLSLLEKVPDPQAQNLARMYRATMKPVTVQVQSFFSRYSSESSLQDRASFQRDWNNLVDVLGKRIQVEEGQFFSACERYLAKVGVR